MSAEPPTGPQDTAAALLRRHPDRRWAALRDRLLARTLRGRRAGARHRPEPRRGRPGREGATGTTGMP